MFEGEHTAECYLLQKEREAWLDQWRPTYHAPCNGSGILYGTYDPSPAGVSLGSGYFVDEEPCTCVQDGICPRCGGKELLPTVNEWGETEWYGPCKKCGWTYGQIGLVEVECSCEEYFLKQLERQTCAEYSWDGVLFMPVVQEEALCQSA